MIQLAGLRSQAVFGNMAIRPSYLGTFFKGTDDGQIGPACPDDLAMGRGIRAGGLSLQTPPAAQGERRGEGRLSCPEDDSIKGAPKGGRVVPPDVRLPSYRAS